MTLNREQIIKALECCNRGTTEDCAKCPRFDDITLSAEDCMECLMREALSLIKELTEENERLRAENLKWQSRLKTECEYTEKITVRKMQTEIEARCIKGGIYPAFVKSTIDQIAKEMVEDL